ncbi:hypothetical protein N2152v2_004707 [Parachlorella kessleri]
MPRVTPKRWPHSSAGPGGVWTPAQPLFSYLFAITSAITYTAWNVSGGDLGNYVLLSPARLLMGSLLHFPEGPLTGWWSLGRILTTTFLPYDAFPGLACSLLLVTAGAEAERVLGRGRFALIFLLAGAAKSVAFLGDAATWDWYPDLEELTAVSLAETCGTGAAIIGVAAAMLVAALRNRQLLSEEDRERWQLATVLVAVVAAAAEQQTLDSSYLAALGAGALLGWAVGPRFEPMPPQQQGEGPGQGVQEGRQQQQQEKARDAAPPLVDPPTLGKPENHTVHGLVAVTDTTPGWRQGLSFATTALGLAGGAFVLEFVFFVNIVSGLDSMLEELKEMEGEGLELPWARELEENQDQFYDQIPDGLDWLLRRPERQLKA